MLLFEDSSFMDAKNTNIFRMSPFNIYLILKDSMPLLQIYESSESYKNLKI